MKISRVVGSVSQKLNIFIQDSTVSTGAGLANVSAATVSYAIFRDDMSAVSSGACSTSTGTLGTYNVSCLTQMSSTNALGWYQFDVPNLAFASGSSCLIHLYGATNMAPLPMEIELTKFDNQSYVSTVKVLGAVNPVGVSTATIPFGVSSISIPVGVSTVTDKAGYGVSSASIPFGVSSVSNLVGVSTLTIPVGVSSISIPVGVSSVTDKAGYGVSSISVGVNASTVSGLVGVSTITTSVNASTVSGLVGVSTVTTPVTASSVTAGVHVSSISAKVGVSTLVGVSTITTPVSASSLSAGVNVTTQSVLFGVSTVTDKINYFLDSTYGAAGAVSTNIAFVKGVAVATGTGTSSDPWGP